MFTTSKDGRCYWFNGNTFEPSIKFELIGVLMGIVIFNRVILDLHFPMIAYGKILGRKPTLESLAESYGISGPCSTTWRWRTKRRHSCSPRAATGRLWTDSGASSSQF